MFGLSKLPDMVNLPQQTNGLGPVQCGVLGYHLIHNGLGGSEKLKPKKKIAFSNTLKFLVIKI